MCFSVIFKLLARVYFMPIECPRLTTEINRLGLGLGHACWIVRSNLRDRLHHKPKGDTVSGPF